MKPVTIYTKETCGYCQSAKRLLGDKRVAYTEIPVDEPQAQKLMAERSGRWSVPQIFIGDAHVGGCDDLHALERAGRLDALLAD